MEALYAGLTAWGIELTVAGIAFYLLYREEQKVYRRREDGKTKRD
jgi:hypothetical protein|tara:strand:+ start:673 stop:807 length:135 start_codon:yes stop_codon:yes gene_type:complete